MWSWGKLPKTLSLQHPANSYVERTLHLYFYNHLESHWRSRNFYWGQALIRKILNLWHYVYLKSFWVVTVIVKNFTAVANESIKFAKVQLSTTFFITLKVFLQSIIDTNIFHNLSTKLTIQTFLQLLLKRL